MPVIGPGITIGNGIRVEDTPPLILDFATSGTLDPRITFTRNSIGTYFNSSGVMQTATANTPRFDYDPITLSALGLRIEPSVTNLVSYSSYNASAWSSIFPANATLTTGISDPAGGTDAVRFTTNGAGNALLRVNIPAFTPNGTSSYTASFYCRRISGSGGVTADLADGQPGGNYASQLVTNQWRRVILTGIPTATSKSFFDLHSDNNQLGSFDYWGVQIEADTTASSLIPTSGSTITRQPDLAIMTGTNFSSWFHPLEGTIVVEGQCVDHTSGFPRFYAIGDGTGNSFIQTFINGSANLIGYEIRDASVFTVAQTLKSSYTGQNVKIANAYQLDNSTGAASGVVQSTDTVCTIPTLNQLTIGSQSGGGSYLSGTIASFRYYSTRWTNDELAAVTA